MADVGLKACPKTVPWRWRRNSQGMRPIGLSRSLGTEEVSIMKVASKSDVGHVRANNEDCLRIDEPLGLLQAAVRTADEAIWTYAHVQPGLRGMGTTVVLALCEGEQVHTAHVGDSRAYIIRGGKLRQLTERPFGGSPVDQGWSAHAPRGAFASPPPSDHPQSWQSRSRCRGARCHVAARGLSAALL